MFVILFPGNQQINDASMIDDRGLFTEYLKFYLKTSVVYTVCHTHAIEIYLNCMCVTYCDSEYKLYQ